MKGTPYSSYGYRNRRISDEMIGIFRKDGKSFIDVTVLVRVSVYVRLDSNNF
jgi:hypothetical protein